MKSGKCFRPSGVSLELIGASRELGTQMMAELCQRVFDGLVMPAV